MERVLAAAPGISRTPVPPGDSDVPLERGYGLAFSQHIQRANEGCDFGSPRTEFGAPVKEPVIYQPRS